MDDELREQYRLDLLGISMLPYYDKSKLEHYLDFKVKHKECSWVDTITFVNIGLYSDYYTNVRKIANPYGIEVLVNKFNKLSENFMPKDLELINDKYNPEGLLLRHEARVAFEEMCRTAERERINLRAISTFRSYYYQWKIYLKDIKPCQPIEEYSVLRDKVSARPGFSEHQSGLAVDINELEQTFETTPEGKWLAVNSYKFGFILRYPKGKEYITGYDYEPWHFRYIGRELAETVYYSDMTYDEFFARYLVQFLKTV